jgi:serine/threonine protein kinase
VASDLAAELATALAGRYELRRLLGRGGMASVYLAYDPKHSREVALKVLRPDLAATLGAERFLSEIQIAARLTHPNILSMHDSGEAGGFLYYVMPYIEGASLRQRLDKERVLDPEAALAVAAPVADALAYAHRMGVLHRDIKPENILLSQGHPIVADFGIAKAIRTAGGTNLTRTGIPLGTPGYMSPEQAAGLSDLDGRTDVYSLAIVIYEMLVGDLPGRWPTEEAVRTGRFLEAPATHRSRLTQLPSRIEPALVRAMAIRLDQRTPTPIELIEDLRGRGGEPRKRYREGEVQEIVKRASELEAATTSGSMTIGGVEALAAEVGIAPETVRAAAQSVTRPSGATVHPLPMRRNPWIGGPTTIVYERVVEGELHEADYEALVDEIRRATNYVGQVNQLGRSFAWATTKSQTSPRDIEIAVSMRAGQTRITVRERLAPLIGGIFGGIGGGMGGGGMGLVMGTLSSFHLLAFAPVVVPAWLLTTYGTARYFYSRTAKERSKELEGIADRLAEVTGELVGERLPGKRMLRSS